MTMPDPLVLDLDGVPYPDGWQPSLGRVRDAISDTEAVVAAVVNARIAPTGRRGNKYTAALVATLLIRLGLPMPDPYLGEPE